MPTEKELLEREIAKLSGVIAGNNRNLSHGHSSRQTTRGGGRLATHPYKSRGGGAVGGNKTYRPGQNNKLVLNNQASHGAQTGVQDQGVGSSASPSTLAASGSSEGGSGAGAKGKMEDGAERWVNSTSRHGNKSLVNPELFLKQQKARLARTSQPTPSSSSSTAQSSKRPPSSSRRKYDTMVNDQGKRVVEVDGVVFEFEGDGKRLRRVEDPTTASQDNADGSPQTTPTRSSFSISGQQYLRTRNGNLVRRKSSMQGLNKKLGGKEKKKKLCRYFTKTGACHRASTCPYIHDPAKISVCSKYLRGTCLLTDQTCPVSHRPSPHNSPSCVHFQRSGQCRNGKDCLYPHVKVKDDAPVCVDLSTLGWCDRGPRCLERHAWECREYSEKGVCGRAEKCELMHILRAKGAARAGAGGEQGVGEVDEKGETEGEDAAMMGTVRPEDLVKTLQANGIGQAPSEDHDMDDDQDDDDSSNDDSDDDDDSDDSEASDHAMVDTEDEADDLAGQRDFISFDRGDGE